MRQALPVQSGQPFRLIGFGGAAAALIEAAAPAFLDHGFAEQVELHADQVIPFGSQIQPAFRFHAPPHDGPMQTACPDTQLWDRFALLPPTTGWRIPIGHVILNSRLARECCGLS